jgi:hypothetical protein
MDDASGATKCGWQRLNELAAPAKRPRGTARRRLTGPGSLICKGEMTMATQDQHFVQQRDRIMARAWADEDFKQRLLAEPAAVLHEYGLEAPPGRSVKIVENTDQAVHLVLPARTQGADPEPVDRWGRLWAQITAQARQDEGFKRRLLAQPAAILRERLGQEVPPGLAVNVLEDSDTLVHYVLPARPPLREGELGQEELATVVGGAFTQSAPVYSWNWKT